MILEEIPQNNCDARGLPMLPIIRTGMMAANKEIATISNNIANAGSTGFKRSSNSFEDIYATMADQVKRSTTGMGTRNSTIRVNHGQGSLKPTNMSLDLAVSGYGMFVTTDPNDATIRYTRDGSLTLNENSQITTSNGRTLLSSTGRPITVPMAVAQPNGTRVLLDSITITPKGQVMAQYGGLAAVNAGQIAIAGFRNMNGLQQLGLNEFAETANSGAPRIGVAGDGVFGTIIQGSVEASNTNISDEMVMMMRAQQAFGAASRMVQADVDITRRLMS
ncbi:flagellar hook-basal body protein [Alphaproteobacteria bacterium LSUCC0684]